MTDIFVTPGDDPLSKEVAQFTAKANCAEHVRLLAGAEGQYEARAVSHIGAQVTIKQRRPMNDEVERLLRSAWQHELASRVHQFVDDVDVLRVGAYALPMSAYYALFNGIRAWCLLRGTPADQHANLQKTFSTQLSPHLPTPWGARLLGDPKSPADCTLEPQELLTSSLRAVDPLATTQNSSEEMLFAALRMARRWKVEAARVKWLESARKPGKPAERYKVLPAHARPGLVGRVPPTTLLDFVYGLRVQVNYQQADEYIAAVDAWRVREFHRGVLFLVSSGLLNVEANIAALAGTAALGRLVSGWTDAFEGRGSWTVEPVARRFDAIESYGSW